MKPSIRWPTARKLRLLGRQKVLLPSRWAAVAPQIPLSNPLQSAWCYGCRKLSLSLIRPHCRQPSPGQDPEPVAQTVGLVDGLDPDFDGEIFEFLSQQYRYKAKPPLSVADICLANAQVSISRQHRFAYEHSLTPNMQIAMQVQLFSVAKIWKLAADWVAREAASAVAQTPAAHRAGKSLHGFSKGGGVLSSPSKPSMVRTRSQTSPSMPLQHLQRERKTSQKSSPLTKSQVLAVADADVSPRSLAMPSRLPHVAGPPRLGPGPGATPRVTDNADLIGSDTSNSTSAQDDTQDSSSSAADTQSPEEEEEELAVQKAGSEVQSQVAAAVDATATSVASNPAMSLSALLSKKRPALAAISRQNTQDGFSPAGSVLQLTSISSSMAEEGLPTPRASVPPTPVSRQMALPLGENVLGLGRPAGSLAMSRTNSSKTQTRFPSRKNSDESSLSSSPSGDDGRAHAHGWKGTGNGSDSGHQTLEERRAKAKKKLQNRTRGHNHSKSRSGHRRRVVSHNDATLGTGKGRAAASRSVSNSRGRSASKARMGQMQQSRDNLQIDANAMLHEITRLHLVQTLQDLADQASIGSSLFIIPKLTGSCVQGDVQTSATMAFLLRDKLQLSSTFFARITAAYLRESSCTADGMYVVDSFALQSFCVSWTYTSLQRVSSRPPSSRQCAPRAKRARLYAPHAVIARRRFTIHPLGNAKSALWTLCTAASATLLESRYGCGA